MLRYHMVLGCMPNNNKVDCIFHIHNKFCKQTVKLLFKTTTFMHTLFITPPILLPEKRNGNIFSYENILFTQPPSLKRPFPPIVQRFYRVALESVFFAIFSYKTK